MSGINSLIDTLMHSVLGKRVDIPQQKELTEPVRPISPSDAPLAVRSDSRLEPGQVAARQPLGQPTPQHPPPSQPADGAPQSSIQASLSPAARAIAEVLARFPSPPSVLQTQAPLVAPGETPSPTELAARLQSSIGQSGLFYEHHLDRWYRGDMTLQQLSREPQMMWHRTMSPLGSSSGSPAVGVPANGSQAGVTGTTSGNVTSSQPGGQNAPMPAGHPPLPAAKPAVVAVPSGQEALRGGAESSEPQRASVAPAELPEPLQAIVRHQLELLTVPVLRWEGDVWTGVFLALLIQPPGQEQPESRGDQDSEADEEQEKPWRSELTLEVRGLGDLSVSIQLLGEQLDLKVAADSEEVLARLQAAVPALQKGLQNCGFSAPVIRFALTEATAIEATAIEATPAAQEHVSGAASE